jgi:hypothetical protein
MMLQQDTQAEGAVETKKCAPFYSLRIYTGGFYEPSCGLLDNERRQGKPSRRNDLKGEIIKGSCSLEMAGAFVLVDDIVVWSKESQSRN